MTKNKKTFKCTNRNVLVLRDEGSDKIGNIFIVGKERPVSGVVKSVSDNLEFNISVGDRVYFSKEVGMEIILDGIEYLVIEEESLLGVQVNEE